MCYDYIKPVLHLKTYISSALHYNSKIHVISNQILDLTYKNNEIIKLTNIDI